MVSKIFRTLKLSDQYELIEYNIVPIVAKYFYIFPGGIGDAVCAAVSAESSITVHKLAVNGLPRSGPSAALLDMFGISSKHIVALAKKIIGVTA